MYLRTYVARAVLDTRRSRVLVTGCGLFGEPLATEQEIALMALRPGAEVNDHFVKFGTRGAALDPSLRRGCGRRPEARGAGGLHRRVGPGCPGEPRAGASQPGREGCRGGGDEALPGRQP